MYTLTSSLIFIYTQMFYIFFYIKQKICIILNYLNLNYPIQPINKVSIIEYTNTSKFKRLTINFYDYLDDIDKYNDSKYVLKDMRSKLLTKKTHKSFENLLLKS